MRSIKGWVFLGLLGFFLPACRDSPTDDVTHQEISEEDSLEAIQKGFVESSEGIPEAEIPAGIDRFFRLLGTATRSEEKLETEKFITVNGMLSALNTSAAMSGLSRAEKKGVAKGFRNATGHLGVSLQQLGIDAHKIVLVEKIDDDQRLVYVKLYDNELSVVTQMRWWLLRTDEGWRTYDYEDLSIGLRVVSLMGSVISSQLGGRKEGWVDDFVPVTNQLQTFDPNDVESYAKLEVPLLKLRKNDLPISIQKFASMTYISILLAKGEFEAALSELKEAEAGGYTTPISSYQKGSLMAELGRHEEAQECYQKHIAKLGSDSDVMEMVSDSYLQAGKRDKAREAALEGLTDNPISLGCLVSLAAASSPEEIAGSAMSERFSKMPNPEEAFEVTIDYLSLEEDLTNARGLFAVLKKEIPESELIEYYEEELMEE